MLRASAESRGKLASLLKKRLARRRGLLVELRGKGIELLETASLVAEETANGTVGTALLVEVLDERLLSAGTVVVNRLVLSTLGEELDRGVALDTVLLGEGLVVLRIGVDVDDEALQVTGQHYTAQWMRRQD